MSALAYEEIRSPEFQSKLHTLSLLLEEAYKHYFANSEGYCKSGEGSVSIGLPEFFWDFNGNTRPTIEVYSYVLGPHRTHYFENIDEALAEVRKWNESEMKAEHND